MSVRPLPYLEGRCKNRPTCHRRAMTGLLWSPFFCCAVQELSPTNLCFSGPKMTYQLDQRTSGGSAEIRVQDLSVSQHQPRWRVLEQDTDSPSALRRGWVTEAQSGILINYHIFISTPYPRAFPMVPSWELWGAKWRGPSWNGTHCQRAIPCNMKAYRLFHVIDNATSSMPMRQWGRCSCAPAVSRAHISSPRFPKDGAISKFILTSPAQPIVFSACRPNPIEVLGHFTLQNTHWKWRVSKGI